MSTTTTPPDTPSNPAEAIAAAQSQSAGLGDVARAYLVKLRGGDVGSLPAILGLITLIIVFSSLRPQSFTNSFNFANLINQSAGVVVLAMGLVFVLLLGEIDLSAGFAGGTSAAVLGFALTKQGVSLPSSIILGLTVGAAIGLAIGLLVAKLGIPSFVVTLAAFLALKGVLLKVVGEGKTISYRNDKILALNNDTLPVWLGWTLAVVGILAFAGFTLVRNLRRRHRGLVAEPMLLWVIKTVVLSAIVLAAVGYLSVERSRNPAFSSLKGVPLVLLVIVILALVLTILLSATSWGRHVYAVGGNTEAARRAGINVTWIKLSCFIICSMTAALAGVLIASRDNGVNGDTGGEQTLLFAVGAAVIGGTSLFGGKGRVTDAIIGGLVIAVIDNGMGLLQQPPSNVQIVTGLVLLLAASVDAISRRRSKAQGLG